VILALDGPGIARRLFHGKRPEPLVDLWAERVRGLVKHWEPDQWLCAWDATSGKSWRKDIWPDYKKNRQKPPVGYLRALPDVGKWCESIGLPVVQVTGYEADDILGSVAAQAPHSESVVLVSDDKDIRQAVMSRNVKLVTSQGKVWDRQSVWNEMGVFPNDIPDLFALMGDKADGIPGLLRIGERTAVHWVQLHRTLERMVERRVRAVEANPVVFTYRDIIRLRCDVDVVPALRPVPEVV
jgi:DNA polymerase-1